MSFRIERDERVAQSVQRIAREQIDKAREAATADDLDTGVHELRKRCKKVRGLIRLVRPGFEGYKEANTRLRDLARTLSEGRDHAAALESHLDLLAEYPVGTDRLALARVGEALVERKESYEQECDLRWRLERACSELAAVEKSVSDWEIDDDDDVLAAGLAKTYERAREAMDQVHDEPSTENLHEWRKRAKYHRYHLRLVSPAWPAVLQATRDEAKRLSDFLGDDHDLALLRDTLQDDPESFGGRSVVHSYIALIDGRRHELQAGALEVGNKLCGDKPKRLEKRMRILLHTWRGRAAEQVAAFAAS